MIDNLVVLTYLLAILGIGIYYRSSSGNFSSYAKVKSSARNSKLLLMTTIFASTVGGGTTFGISQKAFSGDLAFTYGLMLVIPVDLLIAKYLLPKLVKHYGTESIGDIMASYYGAVGRFIAGIAAIMVSTGFLAVQISVSGHIFEHILKINYVSGVVLSYGIVIIYTTIGGLRSVMFTNLLQFFAMILAIPMVTIFGLNKIGLASFIDQLPTEKVIFSSHNHSLLLNTISAALSFSVMNLYPNFIQRALINHDHQQTSRAIYLKTAIYAVFLVFITLNGLIAYNLYSSIDSHLALPHLISQIIPVGLQGFVVAGLLASVMSTADSDLNVISITIVKDLFKPIFQLTDQKYLLLIARISNIAIGSVAIIIALYFSSVVDLIMFISGFWGPTIITPLVFGLFGITISTRMMIASSLGGGLTFLLWEYYLASGLIVKGVFIGTIASLGIFLIGIISKKYSAKIRI